MIDVITADRVALLDAALPSMASSSSRVCIADVFDSDGNLHQVYLKVCLPMKTILAGDIVRWSLAAIMQVPVPSRAWLCHVPVHMVEALWPDLPWREAWGRDVIPGFATLSVYGAAPPALVHIVNDGEMLDRLRKWPGLLQTIALDLWGANADDNIGNTLEIIGPTGEVRYTTVDGGQLLGGDEWTPEGIRAQFPTGNQYRRISKMARAVYGHMLPLEIRNRLAQLSDRHSVALMQCEPSLRLWLDAMLDTPDMADLVVQCLYARASLPWVREEVSYGIA